MALLASEELSKDYRIGPETVHAVKAVSVTIEAGAFVAVMGPSGSGKSTFMHLLGCLDQATAGRYSLAGEDVAALSRNALAAMRTRYIGFVFQTFNLLPRLTAVENVELPLLYAHVPRRVRRERALAMLERVGLSDRLRHLPSQLSGGQQQRVAIARALVNEPRVILADEPTGALDSRTGLEIMALFQALNRDGMTVVVVTHEADVAQFAGRTLRFFDGRMTADQSQAGADAAARLAELAAENGAGQ